MKVPQISPHIDGCTGLIVGQALQQWRKMHPNDRRWQDPEDMLQEALKAAVEVEDDYDPLRDWITTGERKHAKYSSYLYRGLDYRLSKAVSIPLRQKKRRISDLAELDAPLSTHSDVTMGDGLVGDLPLSDTLTDAVDGFLGLCQALSPQAVTVLAMGLLAGNWQSRWRQQDAAILEEIRQASQRYKVTPENLRVLSRSPEGRRRALAGLSRLSDQEAGALQGALCSLGRLYSLSELGKNKKAASDWENIKILECVRCRHKFPLRAIQDGRYLASTLTCRTCYREMARLPVAESCFAKQYSEEAVECRLHCPDRNICHDFGKKKIEENQMTEDDLELEESELEDTDEPEPIEEEATPAKKKKGKSKSTRVDASPPPKKGKVVQMEKPVTEKPAVAAKEKAAKKKVKAAAKGKTKTAKKAVAKKAVAKKAVGKVGKATKKKAAKKAAKSKKEKKPKIPDIYAPPDELGGRWPFNAGSVMRYCFMRMYDGNGVKQEVIRAEVEKAGHGWPFMLKVMRNGGAFDRVRRSHTWKLDENNGRYRVYDIRTFVPAPGHKKPEGLAKRKAS